PERYRRRARLHGLAARAIAILFLAVHGALLGGYYANVLFGRVDTITVVDADTWLTQSKNGKARHYGLEISHPTKPGTIRLETSYSAYNAEIAANARGAHLAIPVRYVPGMDVVQLGEAPRIDALRVSVTAMAIVLMLVFYGVGSQSTRAWYERR